MAYLLDTHTILWFLSGDNQLSNRAIEIIENDSNDCMVSIASLWEASIKVSLNKLNLKVKPSDLEYYLKEYNIEILPITLKHLSILENLPFHHKDPFDRLLLSQSIANNLTIISRDAQFKSYPVTVIW